MQAFCNTGSDFRMKKTAVVCRLSLFPIFFCTVNELQSVDENILNQSDNEMVELLLYGSNKFKFQQNCSILKSSIKFIIKSERFSGSLI